MFEKTSPPDVGRTKKTQSGSELAEQPRSDRTLPAAARRALAEAEERRRAANHPAPSVEIGGRDGLDPARYGDWEKNGIVSDF